MGKTDNTLPWRLRADAGLPDYRRFWAGGHASSIKPWAKVRNRQDRRRAKRELDAGREPASIQPRHSAAYDAW